MAQSMNTLYTRVKLLAIKVKGQTALWPTRALFLIGALKAVTGDGIGG